MSYYNVLLFLHIAGAVVWVGGGAALTILGTRFATVDTPGLEGLFRQSAWLSSRVFTPASLVVLVAGILLVIEGPWSFSHLWVELGLLGSPRVSSPVSSCCCHARRRSTGCSAAPAG